MKCIISTLYFKQQQQKITCFASSSSSAACHRRRLPPTADFSQFKNRKINNVEKSRAFSARVLCVCMVVWSLIAQQAVCIQRKSTKEVVKLSTNFFCTLRFIATWVGKFKSCGKLMKLPSNIYIKKMLCCQRLIFTILDSQVFHAKILHSQASDIDSFRGMLRSTSTWADEFKYTRA